MLAMLATLTSTALADSEAPIYRVCAESVSAQDAPFWSIQATFPYLQLGWQTTHTVSVRPLTIQEPSWMWERPILPPGALPERFIVETAQPVVPGAVLYIDADAIPSPAAVVVVAPSALRPNVLRAYDEQVELELCPKQPVLAAR